MFTDIDPESLPVVTVGPGCTRRDLPAVPGLRAWIVDIAAGAQWPHLDQHGETGEQIYIASGELIEGDRRLGPGTYVNFHPGSSHRPRSETGVRLFGINLV